MRARITDPDHEKYQKTGYVLDLIRADGEYYYIIRFLCDRRVYMVHETKVVIL